jgi:hypothetical protein
VVICANLTSSNFQKLLALILSQGSNDPEVIEDAVPIALLSSVPPSPQMQILLLHPVNIRKVTFMIGSVNSVNDLIRAKAADALAILIFADKDLTDHVDSIERDDYDTKLKAVSTINYLTKEISKATVLEGSRAQKFYSRVLGRSHRSKSTVMRRPVIISQAHSHEVCFSMLNYGVDRVIGINTFKYSVLAFSAIYPGFMNLLSSLTVPSNQRSLKKKFKREEDFTLHTWKKEYEWGTSFQLMEIVIEKNATNTIKELTFSQLCRYLYHTSRGSAICVAINGYDRLNHVIVNPERSVRIGECFSVLVICNSMEMVMNIMQSQNPIQVLKRLRKKEATRLQDLIDENLSDDSSDDNEDNGPISHQPSNQPDSYSTIPLGDSSRREFDTEASIPKLSQEKSTSRRYAFKRATSSLIFPPPSPVEDEPPPKTTLKRDRSVVLPIEEQTYFKRPIKSIPESDLHLGNRQRSCAIITPRKYQQHGLHPLSLSLSDMDCSCPRLCLHSVISSRQNH